ncbi:MAG TPA: TolC family protein [Chitinophagaceae bacterium]|nr:TolC family protein [Chitinophagaceae bacterium]HPH31843.1 TolC family protein [Chitinophagaceae bacterium]HPN57866.1 TolC family protein [Chitinophagaceae bacterium]
MKLTAIYIITLLLILSARPGQAQSADSTAMTPSDSVITFPPLNDLIDSAVKYHPGIRYRQYEVKVKESNLQTQQHNWTRNMGVQADSRYGTFDNFSANDNGQSTTLLNTTNKQFNYGFGVYMKLPLYDLLNRKNQLKQAKNEVEMARSLGEVQETEIRQMVIKQYQDALLRQRLIRIKAQNLGNARVNMEMVEKEFRNGIIPISEYARISDIVYRAESDYELAKTEFITAKLLLEEMVGFKF